MDSRPMGSHFPVTFASHATTCQFSAIALRQYQRCQQPSQQQ